MKVLYNFISLIRWPNLLLLTLNLFLVRFFLVGYGTISMAPVIDFYFILLVSSIVLITAAGYIINDYYDIKIDLVNNPSRVIIGRQISRRKALLIYFILNSIALFLTLWLSKQIFLSFSFCVFLLWLYSNSLKRKPFVGNFIVSFLTAFSIIVLGLFYNKNQTIIYIYAYFAFAISIIREIVKDIEDVKGDNRHGCVTLPIVWGIRKTKMVIEIFSLVFAFSFVSISFIYEISFGWYWIIFTNIFLIFFIKLLIADTQKEYRQLSIILKIIMLVGVLSMILF